MDVKPPTRLQLLRAWEKAQAASDKAWSDFTPEIRAGWNRYMLARAKAVETKMELDHWDHIQFMKGTR